MAFLKDDYPRIGINGLGRIGRLALRAALTKKVRVVSINDPFVDVDYIAYLLKYDSTQGPFPGTVEVKEGMLLVNGFPISVNNLKDPQTIPWERSGAGIVLEATGLFAEEERALWHTGPVGAERVVMAGPSKGIPIFVMGINHEDFQKDMKARLNLTTELRHEGLMKLHDFFPKRIKIAKSKFQLWYPRKSETNTQKI